MQNSELVLALYPNSTGIGYVICENPKELIRYGVARIKTFSNNEHLKRLTQFVKEYNPSIIILRDYRDTDKRIGKRTIKVIDTLGKQARSKGIPVFKYAREDIKQSFIQFGSNTKYGISKTISAWYPELEMRMPVYRKNNTSEHYQMGVFDAFALMLTHFYIE